MENNVVNCISVDNTTVDNTTVDNTTLQPSECSEGFNHAIQLDILQWWYSKQPISPIPRPFPS